LATAIRIKESDKLSVIFFNSGITLCVFEIFIYPEMEPDEQVASDAVEANMISSSTSC
jgi:hypothetical protein